MENTETKHTIQKLSFENKIKKNLNFLAIILGSVLISGSIIFTFKDAKNNNNFVDPDSVYMGREFKDEEFLSGNKNKKIILVEYSDLECPYCKKFHSETIPKILEKYKDKIGLAYRHFPLTIHPKALKESEATLCVRSIGGNTAYANYINKIFENTQGNNSLDYNLLPKFASELNIDITKWNNCMATSTYKEQVQNDLNDGLQVGVQGTPNTFVLIKNGEEYKILTIINGARDEKYVSSIIEQALKITK